MRQALSARNFILSIITLFILFVCIARPSSAKDLSFIKVDKQKLIDDDKKEFKIRGIVFQNDVWNNPELPVQTHHGEEDFKKVEAMGFNTIRFYINYKLFESDEKPFKYKDTGFQWLDKNVSWAKKHNIRLIFCLAVAPGNPGTAFAPEKSFSIWSSDKQQRRVAELWGEIAKRYVKEPSVLGYSLLLYPNPKYKVEPWSQLAIKITHSIRATGAKQIIFVREAQVRELVIEYKSLDTGIYFPSANDSLKNTVYEFQFYDSFEFCFQGVRFAGKQDVSLRYPNPEKVYSVGDVKWESTTEENPIYSTKKDSWQYLEGVPTLVNDPKLVFGYPSFVAYNTGTRGIVWADGIVVKEYNKDKKYLRTIVRPNTDQFERWYFWKREGKGEGYIDMGNGYNSSNSLAIKGTQDDANLSCPDMRFPLIQGHYYQISGYVKGDLLSSKCRAQLRVDFYSIKRGIYRFDKEYIKSRLNSYKVWGKRRNVPILLSDFGTAKSSFTADWGGLRWVNDVLDLCEEKNIPFCYNGYRDIFFGIYTNPSNQLPEKPNRQLIELLSTP